MDGMQRLIAEADARFAEKLRLCVMGQPTNLNVYSDRTYNLRHQIAHNPQLTTDAHFMELLGHVEVALAPEYASQGEVDKALRSLLAGLLKTLLRECVTQTSYSLRKIMVEMIWHWHQDKQREVLDFALDRQFPGARFSRPSSAAVPQQPVEQKHDANDLTEEEWAKMDAIQTSKAAVKEENHDPTYIAHKLSLFRQRDLKASEKQRQQVLGALSPEKPASTSPSPTSLPLGGSSSPAGIKIVYNSNAQEKQRLLKQHIETHNGPSGPEVLVHGESVAPFFNKRPTTAFAKLSGGERGVALVAQPTDIALMRAEGRIMSHLAKRLEHDRHERERVSMLSMLSHNQARLDEESTRRIESQGVSAQTGRACHFILTKEADAVRYLRTSEDEGHITFSPYDHNAVDNRIPSLTGVLGGGTAHPAGLLSPPSQGVADDALDVEMGADCRITPSTIRLDRPMREQMLSSVPQPSATNKAPPPPFNPSKLPIVTRERLHQLKMADKVRNAFAESGAKGAHCPYRAAFRSVVRPTDSSIEECLSLLPLPSEGFPTNPAAETKKKKAKPKASKK